MLSCSPRYRPPRSPRSMKWAFSKVSNTYILIFHFPRFLASQKPNIQRVMPRVRAVLNTTNPVNRQIQMQLYLVYIAAPPPYTSLKTIHLAECPRPNQLTHPHTHMFPHGNIEILNPHA